MCSKVLVFLACCSFATILPNLRFHTLVYFVTFCFLFLICRRMPLASKRHTEWLPHCLGCSILREILCYSAFKHFIQLIVMSHVHLKRQRSTRCVNAREVHTIMPRTYQALSSSFKTSEFLPQIAKQGVQHGSISQPWIFDTVLQKA